MLTMEFVAAGASLLAALLPGYVHPDEWFQSGEIAAAQLLRVDALVPWEFADCDSPFRAVLPPCVSCGRRLGVAGAKLGTQTR
jgi:phosphatidylinositol glycan class Z